MTEWRQFETGDWYSPDLMTPEGHWHPELEQRVALAFGRYPNVNAEWWVGASVALSAVQDWLHERSEVTR